MDAYISVVVPVYLSEDSLSELYYRIKESLEKINECFEIIMVNDGSFDDSWLIIKKLATADKRVKGINLSRNFGQHHAITAGLDKAKGEWVVVMDCDLQDGPEEIVKLYNKAVEGYDMVLGRRANRQDDYIKRIRSKMFFKLLGYFTETKQDDLIGNFGIYHKKVIAVIKQMRESLRCFPVMIRWLGFNFCVVDIVHAGRKYGQTSYSFRKLCNLGINVMLAFSDKPLRLIAKTGFIISSVSLMVVVYIMVRALSGFNTVTGWSSLIVSIWFLSGLIIFTLGVVGIYVGKTFEDVKKRPIYIVGETIND